MFRDLVCGEGELLRRLLSDHQFAEIVGMDVSGRVLDLAESRHKLDRLVPKQRERISPDARLAGVSRQPAWRFDAASAVEVIEHRRRRQLTRA